LEWCNFNPSVPFLFFTNQENRAEFKPQKTPKRVSKGLLTPFFSLVYLPLVFLFTAIPQ
jgi:hypothetical protein